MAQRGTRNHAPGEPRGAAASCQYLTFTVDHELYAIPIALVREVVEFQSITRIPLSPPVVPGVLNLRGAVVPVVDLAVRFGKQATKVGRRTCVVIVEMRVEEAVQPVGVLVDSVSEALEVSADRLEQRPMFGAGLRAEFVAGMLNLEGRFVVVLELESVLSMSELERLVSGRDFEASPTQTRRLAAGDVP
jgi:purine-binding chemotaxis protein CheW